MKILLIGGHGAGDSGAVSTINGVGYQENTENEKVVALIAEALEGYCEVDCYDSSRNAYTDYQNGLLNSTVTFSDYDYVLEIHFNAFVASSSDGVTKGTEVLVRSTQTNNELPTKLIQAIANYGLTNRGVKTSTLAVIGQANNAGTLACLLEVCFIDDPDDMAIYLSKRDEICNSLAQAIISHYGLTKEVIEEEEEMVIYATIDDIPDWGIATVTKLVNNGALKGEDDAGTLNLEYNMLRLLVIHDRLGMYD